MNNQHYSFTFSSFERGDQLSDDLVKLLREASQAAGKAYAPYSQFHVGAALELVDGTIIHGCNQENASYPCGICAERAALYAYGNKTDKSPIKRIAITVINQNFTAHHAPTPCGLCRQVLGEFEMKNKAQIQVILGTEYGKTLVFDSVSDLLPFAFEPEFLLSQ
ncbi:MAG TPA: cytidine deaminase [Saprospiraceae bacterium]|nr:cytidine deaminase [Saprospiraceae bacterium]